MTWYLVFMSTGPAKVRLPPPKAILLLDPHPIVCAGWAELIHRCLDQTVCGAASTRKSCLHAIQTTHPDLLIVDPAIADMDGLELIRHFSRIRPGVPILVVSAFTQQDYLMRLQAAGIQGFLPKTASPPRLLSAIRAVLAGRRVFPRTNRRGPSPNPMTAGCHALSDRELELFRFWGKGYTTQKIAEVMQLSEHTVHVYRLQIKKKLGLKDLSLLTREAVLWEDRQR